MNTRRKCLTHFLSVPFFGLSLQAMGQIPALRRSEMDQNWVDPERQRNVPVRLRWPDENRFIGPLPVVIFSHGLGGTREGGSVWGEAWVDAGFVVIHVQHTGSDLNAVRGVTRTFTDQRALRTLATPEQLIARLLDVSFVLNEIEKRHSARQDLWQRVRPTQEGLAGHSFGAHTTMGMAGQRYPGFEGVAEPRLASFIAFSPTVPVMGSAAEIVPRESIARELQAEHHARLLAITTDWWRATLQADSQARSRLEAPKPWGVGDLWQIRK
jgi:dienelactone hydrolase